MKNARFYYSVQLSIVSAIAVDQDFDADDCILRICKKPSQPMPRITICTILNEDRTQLSFGMAVCSKNDRFVKKIGRELAYKNASENPILVTNVDDNISETRIQICEIIEKSFWEWILKSNKEGYDIWINKLKKELISYKEE